MSDTAAELFALATAIRAERHRVIYAHRVTPFGTVRWLTRHAAAAYIAAENVATGAQSDLYGQSVLATVRNAFSTYNLTAALGRNA